MSTIDERVVAMRFNDSDFKRGVTAAIRGIDDLRAGLTLDNISSGVDTIASRFSAFGAIAFTALQNLTNAAINFGQQIAGAVLDPLVEGGKKRALAIEQAKFQFQGLGMDVEKTMEAALYAVKGTAFGLDEAASAAASLGASQVPLESMGGVLRGISGVAALTGSSYSDIADVFTKVAGQGRVMADDLNRLSSRGMNAAATLAKSMGITEVEVRDMVSEGKISFAQFADVMNNTFGEQATKASDTFEGASSNMRAALARIGAAFATIDYENQRKMLNALTPAIDLVAKAISPVLDAFKEFTEFNANNVVTMLQALTELPGEEGKLPAFFEGLRNIGSLLVSIFGAIRDAFYEIFPPRTAEQVKEMAEAFRKFTEGLTLSEQAADGLKRTAKGFFALFEIGFLIIKGAVDMFARLFGSTNDAAGGILNFTGGIGDLILGFRDALKNGDGLEQFFGKVEGVLRGIGSGFAAFIDWLKAAGRAIVDFIDISGWSDLWQRLVDGVKGFLDFVGGAGSSISGAGDGIGQALGEFFSNFDFSVLTGLLNAGAIGGLILFINNFAKNIIGKLMDALGGAGGGIIDTIKDAFGTLTDTMEAMQARLKADTLIRIATAIGILALSVVALSFIEPERLSSALAAMTVMFIQMTSALVLMDKFVTPDKIAKLPALAGALILLATAMVIFAAAVTIMAGLSWEELAKGMAGMAVGLGLMIGTLAALQKLKIESMGGTAFALILFATAMVVLASAFKIFQTLSWEDIARGLTGMIGTLAILVAVSRLAQSSAQGAAAMFIISSALNVLGAALHVMAALSWDELGRAMVTLAGSLLLMAIGVQAMQGSISGAAAMAIVSVGILILSQALQELAKLSWDDIGRALTVMAGGLAILAGAMALMGVPLVLAGSLGMLAAAAAMTALAPALVLLGSMTWDDIGRGLTILGSALGIIAIAGVLLLPALPGLLGLGIAAMLIGNATLLAGLGLAGMAVGITALALAAGVGAEAIKNTLNIIIGIIPSMMTALAEGLIQFALVIANGGTEITNAISTLINAAITAVADNGPLLVETFHGLLMMMLDKVDESIPRMIEVGTNIIMAFGEAMVVLIPWLVDVGLRLLTGIINGVANNIGRVIDAGTNLIVNFIEGISRSLNRIVQAAAELVINFVNGVAQAIRDNQQAMNDAGQNLASAIVEGMVSGISNGIEWVANAARDLASNAVQAAKDFLQINSPSKKFIPLGEGTGEGLVVGMKNTHGIVARGAREMAGVAIQGVSKSLEQISKAVATDIQVDPTITPILDLSAVRRDAGLIGGIINPSRLDVSGNYAYASSIASARRAEEEAFDDGSSGDGPTTITQNFEQNNYSPKPLSRLELYRQTKNQFAGAKEVKTK